MRVEISDSGGGFETAQHGVPSMSVDSAMIKDLGCNRVLARDRASAPNKTGPLPAARVTLRLLSTSGKARVLATATTDRLGSARLPFTVPARFLGKQTLEASARSRLGRDRQIPVIADDWRLCSD